MANELDRLDIVIESSAQQALNVFNQLNQQLNQVNVTVNNNTKTVTRNANEYKKLNSVWKTIKAAGIYTVFRQITRALTESIKVAANYQETLNLFRVTFGDMAEEANEFSHNFANAFGFDVANTQKLIATLNQMAYSAGLTNDAAFLLSKTLTALSYDIASLYNLGTEDVARKIQSTLAGVSRAFAQQGLSVYASDVDALLQEQLGYLNLTNAQLSLQERYLARANILLQSTRNSWGNMADEIEQPVAQIRVFQEQIGVLVRNIGNLFLGAFSQIIPYVNGFLIAINQILNVVGTLMGYGDIIGGLSDASDNSEDILNNFEETDKVIGGLVNGVDKFTTAGGSTNLLGDTGAYQDLLDLLQKTSDEFFAEQNEALAEMNNRALQIAETIASWIFPTFDPDEETLEAYLQRIGEGGILGILRQINPILQTMGVLLAAVIGTAVINGFIKLGTAIATAASSTTSLGGAIGLAFAGISLILIAVDKIVSGWDTMSKTAKALSIVMLALGAALVVVAIAKTFATYGPIAGGILVAGMATAIGLGVAGIVNSNKEAVNSAATPFAKGGIITGEVFGRIGEYSGVQNNPEIVTPLDRLNGLIGDSISEALGASGNGSEGVYQSSPEMRIVQDGQVVARVQNRHTDKELQRTMNMVRVRREF